MTEHVVQRAIFNPFISFDLLNITNGNAVPVQSNILLNKFYSIYTFTHLNRNDVYLLHIVGGIFPMEYILQVMSQHHTIRNLSHEEYLKEFQNYTLTSFHCEHSVIERDKFFLIARIAITVNEDDTANTNEQQVSSQHHA